MYKQTLEIYFIHAEANKIQKIKQNLEKRGRDDFPCFLENEFHLHWSKIQIMLLFWIIFDSLIYETKNRK